MENSTPSFNTLQTLISHLIPLNQYQIMCQPPFLKISSMIHPEETLMMVWLPKTNQHPFFTDWMEQFAKDKVAEYWIINPTISAITIYCLDETEQFYQYLACSRGIIQSPLIETLVFDLNELFI